MRSMTGFGQGAAENQSFRIAVTVRTVNHRFLDLKVRMSDDHRRWESEVIEVLREELKRGRIDVRVDIEEVAETRPEVRIRSGVLRGIQTAIEELRDSGLVSGELTPGEALRLPEVLKIRVPQSEWTPADVELLRQVTRTAVEQVVESRSAEGERLGEVLSERLERLRELCALLEERREEIRKGLVASLRERLAALLEDTVLSEERLAVEAAVLADKSDVREELDRLAAHLARFVDLLARPGSVGRSLDFISQEILRELNTIGAKCRNADMSQAVVDGRTAAEQLREQIQNIE